MSYKTILVHLEHALSMRKSLDVAIRLAEQEDAHLIGVATCLLYTSDAADE